MAAGRGPENLYENITRSTLARIEDSLPASKGKVDALVLASGQASDAKLEAVNSKLEAQLAEYKNMTSTIINSLVDEVNALTPVGC